MLVHHSFWVAESQWSIVLMHPENLLVGFMNTANLSHIKKFKSLQCDSKRLELYEGFDWLIGFWGKFEISNAKFS